VVEAFASSRERFGHRGVLARRGEQLDVRIRHPEEGLLDAVGFHDLPVRDLAAERVAVVGDRSLEVMDRDRDVVDLGEDGHAFTLSAADRIRSGQPWRRKRVIWGSSSARRSGFVTPSPSSGARHKMPSLPS